MTYNELFKLAETKKVFMADSGMDDSFELLDTPEKIQGMKNLLEDIVDFDNKAQEHTYKIEN